MDDLSGDAELLADLVSALEPQEAKAVAAILLDSCERKLSILERLDGLRLIIELVDEHGRYPISAEYDGAREAAIEEGRKPPSRREMSDDFGGYRAAVTAAYDLYMYGTRRRPRRTKRGKPRAPKDPPYTPDEIMRVFAYFRARFGAFPRITEYRNWRDLECRTAREQGRSRPRLPSVGRIRKDYLPYDQAVADARIKWERGAVTPLVEGMPPVSHDRRVDLDAGAKVIASGRLDRPGEGR